MIETYRVREPGESWQVTDYSLEVWCVAWDGVSSGHGSAAPQVAEDQEEISCGKIPLGVVSSQTVSNRQLCLKGIVVSYVYGH